jgi:hypothetical protein
VNKSYGIFKHFKDTEILVLPATDEESYDDQESEPNVVDSYEVINENEIYENEAEEDLDSEGENNLVEEIPITSRRVSGLQREIRNLKRRK